MGEFVPRIFGDVEGWLESTFGQLGVHPIRVEEFREQDRYVLRAEVPGIGVVPLRETESSSGRSIAIEV